LVFAVVVHLDLQVLLSSMRRDAKDQLDQLKVC